MGIGNIKMKYKRNLFFKLTETSNKKFLSKRNTNLNDKLGIKN